MLIGLRLLDPEWPPELISLKHGTFFGSGRIAASDSVKIKSCCSSIDPAYGTSVMLNAHDSMRTTKSMVRNRPKVTTLTQVFKFGQRTFAILQGLKIWKKNNKLISAVSTRIWIGASHAIHWGVFHCRLKRYAAWFQSIDIVNSKRYDNPLNQMRFPCKEGERSCKIPCNITLIFSTMC